MKSAIVQSAFDFAIREINALEGRIVKAEDNADEMLWEQARQVAAQLDAGSSLRKLAVQWLNLRTGEPYHFTHVGFVAKVYSQLYNADPRPRFRDAYNEIAHAGTTAHVSQNTGNNEWYTPKEYIAAATVVLGQIDLDPASSAEANAIVGAKTFYTLADEGTEQPWLGRVWLNPPYAQPEIQKFATKLADSVRAHDVSAAIVLVNNATETEWFRTIADVARGCCFPEGRVKFWSPDRDSATPLQGQAVFYVGNNFGLFHHQFSSFGTVWEVCREGWRNHGDAVPSKA
jgi:ParB family chromosome partitioning protein